MRFEEDNSGKKFKPQKYSDSARVRRFALTLHGYSPKAYRFLRETYANILPHEVTMNEWLSKLDVSTGCSAAALAHLTVMS